MSIKKNLVSLNLQEGLELELAIKKGPIVLVQDLDYYVFPFKCVRCHEYIHIVHDWNMPFKKYAKKEPNSPQGVSKEKDLGVSGEDLGVKYLFLSQAMKEEQGHLKSLLQF